VHYNEGLWVDFVRGLAPADLASKMQVHLASGCSRCAALVTSLAAVEETFSRDRSLSVPPDVVNRARALFPPLHRRDWHELPREIASLIFDSSIEPALAGVRSSHLAAQHLSFASGEWHVDVQIDQQSAGNAIPLTGQLSSDTPHSLVADVPVQLLRGDRVLDEVRTSEFGEFQFDLPYERHLGLLIAVDGESKLLKIDLNRSSDGSTKNEAASSR